MSLRRICSWAAALAVAFAICFVGEGVPNARADAPIAALDFTDVTWVTPAPGEYPVNPSATVVQDDVDLGVWFVYRSGGQWLAVNDYDTFEGGVEYGIMFFASPTNGKTFAEGMSAYMMDDFFGESLIVYDHDTSYAKCVLPLGTCSEPIRTIELSCSVPIPGVTPVMPAPVTVKSGGVEVGTESGDTAYIHYYTYPDYYSFYEFPDDDRVPPGYRYGVVAKLVAPMGKMIDTSAKITLNGAPVDAVHHFGRYVWIESPFGSTPTITRLAGDYANETAAQIALANSQRAEWAVIARDDDFADALGASGLAGALWAPIILTDRESLSPAAASAIQELGVKHVYIIGGTGAIKPQVDADLEVLGVTVEDRVWGENSYDTSLECAHKIQQVTGMGINDLAFVAMSTNFQDALSASSAAYILHAPIILQTWGDTSADRGFTEDARAELHYNTDSVIVLGGTGAISDESVNGLHVINRLWGETGYDTSEAIARWGLEKGILMPRVAVVACGAQAPKGTDALAGSALAGRYRAPLLLVNGNEAMEAANTTTIEGIYKEMTFIGELRHTYVLGGEYVIPQDIYHRLAELSGAVDYEHAAG